MEESESFLAVTEQSHHKARVAAVGALLAVGLAAAAQVLLERDGLRSAPSSGVPGLLFLIAAVLAVVTTWKRDPPATGQRPFRIVLPGALWFAALGPGIGLLGLASWLHARPGYYPAHPATLALWGSGVVILLLVGVAHSLVAVRRGPERIEGDEDWPTGALVLCVVGLFCLSLALRTMLGIDHLPGFVVNDEATTGLEARQILGARPYAWFDIWWVGVPNMALVFTRVAEIALGDSLRGIRMGGAILGAVSVVFLFDFGRRLIGNLPGLVAALLLATAHVHVHWSRNGQHFLLTVVGAAIVLSLFVRAWTGGSLLSWVGAGVALGIFTQTYQASYILPVMLLLTVTGWAFCSGVDWKGALVSTLLVELIALLLLAPVTTTLLREWHRSVGRPSTLSVFNPRNLAELGQRYGIEEPVEIVREHVKRAAMMFNTGTDFYPPYQAGRSFVDGVTAVMIPLAAAMLLVRLCSPVGWLFWTWTVAYLTVGVVLCAHPPAYHRIPAVLLGSSLAVAWAVDKIAQTVREEFCLPQKVVPAAGIAFAVAAGAANIHFYFSEFNTTRPTEHTAGYTRLLCRYARTRTIIDATVVDGYEYVPLHNVFPQFQCPEAKRIRVERSADVWRIDRVTAAARVVLIVPRPVVEAHPGTPQGYRITRHSVDRSVKAPVPLELNVYELDRIDGGSEPDDVSRRRAFSDRLARAGLSFGPERRSPDRPRQSW